MCDSTQPLDGAGSTLAVYAVKVRPLGCTAWFWLREWQPLRMSTLRQRAAMWLDIQDARDAAAIVNRQHDISFQVVRLYV